MAGQIWQMIVAVLCLAAFGTQAQAGDDGERESDRLRRMLSAEVTCDSIAVVDYADDGYFSTAKATVRKFDKLQCAQELSIKPLTSYLGPAIDSFASGEIENPIPENESKVERDKRIARYEASHREMVEKVRERVAPLAGLCERALSNQATGNPWSACYFGAPEPTSNTESQAIFHALAVNSLPPDEKLCTAEGEPVSAESTPEFLPFATPDNPNINWKTIKKKLEADGFLCRRSESAQEVCSKLVLELLFPSSAKKAEMKEDGEDKGGHSWFVALRLLSIEQGWWKMLGPYGCIFAQGSGRAPEGSCDVKPLRGSSGGVCMSGEDWHVWARVIYFLNGD